MLPLAGTGSEGQPVFLLVHLPCGNAVWDEPDGPGSAVPSRGTSLHPVGWCELCDASDRDGWRRAWAQQPAPHAHHAKSGAVAGG